MAKSKKEVLRALRENEGYCYIGDLSSFFYHAKNSDCLIRVATEDLRGLGKKPEKSGFRPCPVCQPEKDGIVTYAPPPVKKKQPRRSKAIAMRDAMQDAAARYDLHLEFIGPNVYVTTMAGEWYFDYNVRPIVLHHKNNKLYSDRSNRPKKYYHEQEYSFPTPLTALQYIYRHENAAVRLGLQIPDDAPVPTLQEAVQTAERSAIAHALKAAGGSKKRAAEALQISVKTLYRKRRLYGLDEDE